MSHESQLEHLISEFVDDLNEGKEPRLYDYLLDHPDEADELLPLMNFVGWYKAVTMEMPEQEKESIRGAILNPWTMRRLVETSSPELVENAAQSGLTQQQIEQLSKDETPIDLGHPNEVVRRLSDKYDARFFNLLGWVRRLITDVSSQEPHSSTMSPAFTRKARTEADDSKVDSDD
jgi:hypothetical protein